MLGISTIDILIGLTVVFLLLSLTCSALIELIASWCRWRAANLATAVSGLLQDDKGSIRAFYAHRRIWTLSPDPQSDNCLVRILSFKFRQVNRYSRPSYIPADTFSQVLLDLIVPSDAPAVSRGRFSTIRHVVLHGPGEVGKVPPGILLDKNVNLTVILRSFIDQAAMAADDSAPDADARRLDSLNAALRNWFNETMDRASGWYKRRTRSWIFGIGLVAAVSFNIDAIALTQALYTNPALREQARTLGEQLAQKTPATQPATAPQTTSSPADEIKQNLNHLAELGLPIGWTSAPGKTWYAYLLKLFGLAITAVAVSLGAPFWFDMLNKLVNLRAAGAPPQTTAPNTSPSGGTSTTAPPITTSGPAAADIGLPADYWSQESRCRDFTRFSAATEKYEPVNAACLARAALLAYMNEDVVQRVAIKCWKALDCRFVNIKDTQAFVANFENFVLVAFRGTEPTSLQDILADAHFALADPVLTLTGNGSGTISFGAGKAHGGFLRALAVAARQIDELVTQFMTTPNAANTPKTLWITGHSLGAALATLYAARIQYPADANKIHGVASVQGLYTFGCPRVGNRDFVNALAAPLATATYRFINDQDIVTRVAPRAMGYDHVGHIMYLDRNGELDLTKAGWVRFLNTILDAVTNLKLAARTSVKDHSMELYVRKLENLANA